MAALPAVPENKNLPVLLQRAAQLLHDLRDRLDRYRIQRGFLRLDVITQPIVHPDTISNNVPSLNPQLAGTALRAVRLVRFHWLFINASLSEWP